MIHTTTQQPEPGYDRNGVQHARIVSFRLNDGWPLEAHCLADATEEAERLGETDLRISVDF